MTDKAKRFNSGKNQLGLITPQFREQLGLVLTMGVAKYDRDNWRNGLSIRSIMDSTHRHLLSFESGIDVDDESGLPHLAHVAANIMFAMHFTGHSKWDDRIIETENIKPLEPKEEKRSDNQPNKNIFNLPWKPTDYSVCSDSKLNESASVPYQINYYQRLSCPCPTCNKYMKAEPCEKSKPSEKQKEDTDENL